MSYPNFSFEKKCWRKGYALVIGVDEVGRGAFAGPVVAGAVALKRTKYQVSKNIVLTSKYYVLGIKSKGEEKNTHLPHICNTILKLGINDSKKLTSKKREQLAREIKKYFYIGIGEGSVAEINRLGIVKATERAMRRAIKKLTMKQLNNVTIKSFVLVDAFHVKYISGVGLKNQKAIVGGDGKSISIAAASIVAKVYRDRLMRRLANKFRRYRWEKNKGYGTESHQEAIIRYGTTKLHRRQYIHLFDTTFLE